MTIENLWKFRWNVFFTYHRHIVIEYVRVTRRKEYNRQIVSYNEFVRLSNKDLRFKFGRYFVLSWTRIEFGKHIKVKYIIEFGKHKKVKKRDVSALKNLNYNSQLMTVISDILITVILALVIPINVRQKMIRTIWILEIFDRLSISDSRWYVIYNKMTLGIV